jgi:hypothetical protein
MLVEAVVWALAAVANRSGNFWWWLFLGSSGFGVSTQIMAGWGSPLGRYATVQGCGSPVVWGLTVLASPTRRFIVGAIALWIFALVWKTKVWS